MSKVFDISYVIDAIPNVLKGIPATLSIAAVAFVVGIFLGFIGANAKIYNVPVLKQIVNVYVSFIRGTPLIVQIFLIYYGIPIAIRAANQEFGTNIDISRIPAIIFMFVAFSLNSGAYLTETIRAAIISVDKGQMEAAYSVGMTTRQAMFRIIIPQALKVGLPNISNHFISMLKDTSLAFSASVPDIMGQAKIVAGRTSRFFEAYIVAAMVYWIICFIFEFLITRIEKRVRRNEKSVSI